MALKQAGQRSESGRLDLIHVLRGAAALLVLFGHISIATSFQFPSILGAFGQFPDLGVFIFFVISGFVVPWSLWTQRYTIHTFPKYMMRRLVRLDPPYFAMVAVGLVVAAYRSRAAGAVFPYSGATIALHLGYLSGLAQHPWIVTVFWTLGIEFQFYILMGLAYPLFAWIPKWVASATVTVERRPGVVSRSPTTHGFGMVLLAFLCLEIVLATVYVSAIAEQTWIHYSGYFFVGILAFSVKTQGLHWAALAAYCLVGAGISGFSLEWGLVSVLGLLIVTLPERLGWVWTTRFGSLANALGLISYSLYLTHPVLVGSITHRAVTRGWISSPGRAVAVYAAEISLCLSIATLFYFLVERPATKLSHRIKLKSTAS